MPLGSLYIWHSYCVFSSHYYSFTYYLYIFNCRYILCLSSVNSKPVTTLVSKPICGLILQIKNIRSSYLHCCPYTDINSVHTFRLILPPIGNITPTYLCVMCDFSSHANVEIIIVFGHCEVEIVLYVSCLILMFRRLSYSWV